MIEQTREIVKSVNSLYGNILVEPEGVFPPEGQGRIPGLDGNAKMSKSLGNTIYLSDDEDTLRKKIMSIYTDPDHVHVESPGKIEGNIVFTYLDIFGEDKEKIKEMKEHYKRGGLGDVTLKNYLFDVLNEVLLPIRTRRELYAKDPEAVYEMLRVGSEKANVRANKTLQEVKSAMGINYFNK